MKDKVYVIIAIVIFLGPFLLSFHPWVSFISRLPAVLISSALIGGLYIFWDSLAVKWGHWRFNDVFVGKSRWFGLPPGEWLFFFVVPYACLFMYEVAGVFFPVTALNADWVWLQVVLGVVFGVLAWVWRRRGYTLLALGSVGVFWLVSAWLAPGIVTSSTFWIFIGLSTFAFLVVNGLYVNLPTIFYNDKAIWGIRFLRIPLEDFFYNFSLLGLCLLVYLQVR